jgi:hypothetical protein
VHHFGSDHDVRTGRFGPARPSPGRHWAAVERSLATADAAAERGDYAEALSWLQTVEAIGDPLSDEFLRKRARWHEARLQAH